MNRAHLIIEINHEDAGREVREYGRWSDARVAALLRELSATSGASLTVRPSDRDAHLIVAVDGPNVFVGLDGPDGIFEYEGAPDREGVQTLRIGRQETTLDARFVMSVEAAVDCIEGWLAYADVPASAPWRRR